MIAFLFGCAYLAIGFWIAAKVRAEVSDEVIAKELGPVPHWIDALATTIMAIVWPCFLPDYIRDYFNSINRR